MLFISISSLFERTDVRSKRDIQGLEYYCRFCSFTTQTPIYTRLYSVYNWYILSYSPFSGDGQKHPFSKVGMEPTGDPFNSIIKLETASPSKPLNPMINAGALAITSILAGDSNDEKMERILSFVRDITDNPTINYSLKVAASELGTAYLNRSLCYYMKQNDIIHGDVEALMDLYTRQCAIEVNCIDLARIGLIFAMDGYDPYRKKQIVPKHITKICKTFMVTCGMYNESGKFAIRVGIPAKSGVSGGIFGCVKGEMGIGIFGPALDANGNSIAGIKILELLSLKECWSIF